MYHININDEQKVVERLEWVKLQRNGVFINCPEEEGHGIIVEGEIYHVAGRRPIDKPTVFPVWQEDVPRIAVEMIEQDCMIIDQEYRLTLLELGVF